MADREFRFDFLAKDGVTPVVRRVGEAVDELGDDMRGTADDAQKLDREIDEVKLSLVELAAAFAATDDEAARLDLTKAMRTQQAELRKLTKVQTLLPTEADVTGPAEDAGLFIGKHMAFGISRSQAVIGAAVLSGFTTLGPLIGATVAGAVVGAAGIGGVVGGVVIASRDVRVKAAATSLGDFVGKELEKAAEPMVPATLTAIGKVKVGFAAMGADLRGIFSDSAKLVSPFTDALVGMVSKALPGIRSAISKAGPVFDVFAKELPELGATVGRFFQTMGDHAGQGAVALKLMFDVVEWGIGLFGKGIGMASDFFGTLITAGLDVVDVMIVVRDAINDVTGNELEEDNLGHLRQKLAELRDGMQQAGSTSEQTGASVGFMGEKAATSATEVLSLKDAFDKVINSNISLMRAEINAEQAVDSATEAIKRNGKATDDGSDKARANRTVILNAADAFNQLQQKMLDSGASAEQVQGAYQSNRDKLIKMAQAAGYGRDEARDLAAKILALPPGKTIPIDVDTGAAFAKLRLLRAAINAAASASNAAFASAAAEEAKYAGARAEGGPVSKGKAYIVGEHRPEVFVPDRDGVIIPSIDEARSAAAISAGGGPAPTSGGTSTVVLELHSDGTRLVDLLVELLQNAVRVRGGNVQMVLGKG